MQEQEDHDQGGETVHGQDVLGVRELGGLAEHLDAVLRRKLQGRDLPLHLVDDGAEVAALGDVALDVDAA